MSPFKGRNDNSNLSKKFAEIADTVSMKPEIVPSVKQSERSKEVEKVTVTN